MADRVVHFEISVPDGAAVTGFYAQLFGWRITSMPDMGYALVQTEAGGGIDGGIGTSQDGSSSVTFYVAVDDLQQTLDRVGSLGGRTVVPVTEIPDVVTFAQFADPQGNVIGLVGSQGDPAETASGDNPRVDWFEIVSPDAAALWRFYSELFGWSIDGGPDGTAQYGEVRDAGIGGGIGAHEHGHVTVYVSVDDVQKYLEQAEALGGTIVTAAAPIGSNLTIGHFADPQGAVVGLYTFRP